MKKRILPALLALLCLFAGCGERGGAATGTENEVTYPAAVAIDDYDAQRAVREENPVSDATLAATGGFAYRCGAALLSGAENACLSPLSVQYALTLLSAGAAGETQREICDALGVSDAAGNAREMGDLMRRIYTDNEAARLLIANSLWLGQDTAFRQDYLDLAASELYSALRTADFSDPATADRMAAWIRENTGGLIEPDVALSPNQVMAILNTIYFKAPWRDAFNPADNETRPFHAADGTATDAEFLVQEAAMSDYVRGEGFLRGERGLTGAGKMVFVLPDEGTPLSALTGDAAALEAALTGGEAQVADITYRIPKFTIDSDFDLRPAFSALGITGALSEGADFSNMTETPVFVSAAKQQAHVAIDETGVEAAAYTMLAKAAAADPAELEKLDFTLDRPFLFAITAQNGALIFLGTVCSVAK